MAVLSQKHKLDALLPYGMITTKQWLFDSGLSIHRIDNALKSKKLLKLASGVYARAGVPITWQGVVCSLQHMSEQTIHVGGLSALELLGFGHYVSEKNPLTIHLYSQTKLPTWLGKLPLQTKFQWHGVKSLWQPGYFEWENYALEHNWREELPPITLSCAEKAYLELLMSVPKHISVDHANELMQGMTNLSPKKLTTLLSNCRNVKVKRLFFWLAEKQGYSWSKKLDYKKFDLGKGKRVITTKGKFVSKYQITVPEHLYG